MQQPDQPDETEQPQRAPFPIVTTLACAYCSIAWGAIAFYDGDSWEAVSRWGALSASDIWDGAWWALVTSAFVHFDIWHIAFGVYWLWVLGCALERGIGGARWVIFLVAAAWVSSSAQLAVSDDTGIGMSGVLYAFFGFMWLTRDRYPGFRSVVDDNARNLFLFWAVGCLVVTHLGYWNVGNTAHFSGLGFGILLGLAVARPRWRMVAASGAVLLLAAAVVPLVYAPWSVGWTSHRAYEAHSAEQYDDAERWYRSTLKLGADEAWAWENLCLVYGAAGNKAKEADAFKKLRRIDPQRAGALYMEIYGTPAAD